MFNFLGFAAQVCVICVSIALIINTHEYICSQDAEADYFINNYLVYDGFDSDGLSTISASSVCAKSIASPAVTTVIREDESSPSDINSMTIRQLKALCKQRGVKRYSSLRKHELISLLSKS